MSSDNQVPLIRRLYRWYIAPKTVRWMLLRLFLFACLVVCLPIVSYIVTVMTLPDRVYVRGRITDGEGNPVTGAHVRATDNSSSVFVCSSMSDNDGVYEVGPFFPCGPGSIALYLAGETDHSAYPKSVDVRICVVAKCSNYEYKVPLMTRRHLMLARIESFFYMPFGPAAAEPMCVKPCKGNKIIADIVLKKVDKAVK